MRTQTFGVELEMTGITRKTTAEVAAAYFGTRSEYIGSSYDKYAAKDSTGRLWSFVSDSSIRVERGRNGEGQQVEMVTPILHYEDIELLQELIRRLRKAGAKTNSSCGIHIHVGADQHTPRSLRNLVNIFTSKQDIIFKALAQATAAIGTLITIQAAIIAAICIPHSLRKRLNFAVLTQRFTQVRSRRTFNSA